LYAEDNPINLTDPSGHDPWWCEGRIDAPACTQAHLSSQTAPWSALTPQQQQLAQVGVLVLKQWAKNHQAQVQLQNTVRAFAHGVVFQFLDDESLGLTATLDPVSAQDTDPAFVTGRHFGRGFSAAFSALEIGIGGGCGLGGAVLAPTGVGVVVLGSGAVLLIGHGGAVIVRNAATPIPLPNFNMAKSGGNISEEPSSERLAKNMEEDGRPRPPNSDAHHIVAGRDPRAADARRVLIREKIGINEADNGAWLPRQFHWRVHTDEYYREVNNLVIRAKPGTVRDVLRNIADQIVDGTFP
jgi:hypothetical protein